VNLYLDASALVKRYVAESGSAVIRRAMQDADAWFMCRIGFVETVRAVALSAGGSATRSVRSEWPAFGIVEVDQALVEHAAALAGDHGLRSLDSLHLAAALLLRSNDLVLATWDRRLRAAAQAEGLQVLPEPVA
jgi:predicted nucleic acid-binding protein